MFHKGFSTLMLRVKPDSIPLPRVARLRQLQAEKDAERAMRCTFNEMTLSQRMLNPAAYRELQQSRRSALEALLAMTPNRAIAERAADLIAMILEESAWSANESGAPFDEESHPEIDLQAVETAVLLGWTRCVLGDALNELSPRIVLRMVSEVRRRIFRPVQLHDDYPFMSGEGTCPMAVAAGVLLAALLLENEEARLGRIVKPALTLLDETCGRHTRRFAPLAESITDISAVSDLAMLLKEMTGGAMDLTDTIPTGDWLDEILFAWIQDLNFVDPAGDGMHPPVSGGDIFRIGRTAGDEPLLSLGALVYHRGGLPSRTVTGRLLELSACAAIEATSGKPPRLRYGTLRGNRLMAARIPGLYCSLHTGGDRANAGDLCLFADETAILADGGRSCTARNLPVLGGMAQLDTPAYPCIADFEDRADREIMSIELTHAYPKECGLRSYQRTVLTLRGEQTVRIMDALSFHQPQTVAFSFVTAARPAVLSSAVRLGTVRLTWEGDFTVSAVPLEGGLTQLDFTTEQPVQQSIFAFNFERA